MSSSGKVGTGIILKSLDPPERDGWMTKQGGSVKTWKRRWFVLKGATLYYFKANKPDSEAQGQIDLTDKTSVKKEEKRGKKHSFAIYTAKRVFFMYPDQPSESDAWMKSINTSIERMRPNQGGGGGGGNVGGGGITAPPSNNSPAPQTGIQSSGGIQTSGGGVGAGPLRKGGKETMANAKNEVYFLKEEDSKVLEFWQIWSDSIPPREEIDTLPPGSILEYEVATSADMQKLTWRTAGPQNIFIQKMVDFFWNVGAPESEIDRLNDVGALINPVTIGSWIDMSSKGGMDGGWYFPCEIPLKFALESSDPGDPTKKVAEWAESRGINQVYAVGRDMGAAPPRQTELRFKLPGMGFEDQLQAALSAYSSFGFPSLPDEALNILRGSPKLGLRLSVITSSEGFVRLGLLMPDPDGSTVDKLCPMSGASSSEPLVRFASALGLSTPQYVEFQYLQKGFGYGVYKEGFDVVFHYHVK